MSRLRLRGWVLAITVVGVLALIVALLGGFKTASADIQRYTVGEWVTMTRWEVRVDGCQRSAGYQDGESQVSIAVTLRNTWTETQTSFGPDAVRIEMPDHSLFGFDGEFMSLRSTDGLDSQFDPGFTRSAAFVMNTPDSAFAPGDSVAIAFANETLEYATVVTRWVYDGWAGLVEFDCPVRLV